MEELSPGKGAARGPGSKKNGRATPAREQGSRIHIVRRGEALAQIARRYRVNLAELARKNAIRRKAKVAAGTRLEIPE